MSGAKATAARFFGGFTVAFTAWTYFIETLDVTPTLRTKIYSYGWIAHLAGVLFSFGVGLAFVVIYGLISSIVRRMRRHRIAGDLRQKFPRCLELRWYPKYRALCKALKEHNRLFLSGPHGSGKSQIGMTLLREIGFEADATVSNSAFILIDFRRYATLARSLDALLTAIGASQNTGQLIEDKIDVICQLSQKLSLSILLQDIDVLPQDQRRTVCQLVYLLPTRIPIVVTSSNRFPEDFPLTEYQIENLSLTDTRAFADSLGKGSIFSISEDLYSKIRSATHGHFGSTYWILQKAQSLQECETLISQFEAGRGALPRVVEIVFCDFSEDAKGVLSVLSQFGGSIRKMTLQDCPPIEGFETSSFLDTLSRTPFATVNFERENGFLAISREASDVIAQV